MKNLFLIFFTLIFLSCKNEKAKVSESVDSDTIADFSEIIPETKTVSKENILKHLNDEIIESLKEKITKNSPLLYTLKKEFVFLCMLM